MRKIKLVISDLHLGRGRALPGGATNPLEEFYFGQKLVEFFQYYSAGEFRDADVELVINGDFLNCLQVDYRGHYLTVITESISVEIIQSILDGHPEVFEAMRAFAALPGRTFNGKIALIGQSVDADSRTVAVRIDLPNRDRLLRPGMSATAWLPVGEQGTLLAVPAAAVQRVRDRWCVFIPKDNRTFEIRPVGRGRDIAGEVEILSGLRAGDPIVVDGAFLLKAETERSAADGEHDEKRND